MNQPLTTPRSHTVAAFGLALLMTLTLLSGLDGLAAREAADAAWMLAQQAVQTLPARS